MIEGLDTGLAALLITWGTPLAGMIPVLIAWGRLLSERKGAGQCPFPRALWALTAAVCVDPAGLFVLGCIRDRYAQGAVLLVNYLPRLWVGCLAVGFLLDVVALATLRENAR